MLNALTAGASHIYLACGVTDFRKQVKGLSAVIRGQFHLDPYASSSIFLFCNKKRNALKILRYDSNGFLLVSKYLLDDQKFQWPRNKDEVRDINPMQFQWLLQGIAIDQKKALHDVDISEENSCF